MMWIRSQYKEILTNCNVFYIDEINSSYTIEGNIGVLGSYSTKEKAMKVLDMLEEQIDYYSKENFYIVFQMPLDSEVE